MSEKRYELKVYSDFTVMEGLNTPFDYLDKARLLGISGMAITDRMTVAGFYDWMSARENLAKGETFQSIFGVELLVQNDLFPDEFHKTFCVSVLAKNMEGVRKLYRILSACAKGGKDTAVSLQYLTEHREDLLLGSCTEQGIFFHRANNNHRPESYFDAAAIFDYLEICPTMEEDIVTIITMLGEHHGIPVVAVSDARYCYRAQKAHYHALCSANALTDVTVHDKELCSAAQLLRHFAYLGEENAKKVVFEHPAAVAEKIASFALFSNILQSITPKSDTVVSDIRAAVAARFGDHVPDFVTERVNEELSYFAKQGLFGHLQTLYRVSSAIGDCFVSNSYANCYLLYLLGVTRVDPLASYLYCPDCHTAELAPQNSYGETVCCPNCGRQLIVRGANLPFSNFVWSKEKNFLSFSCTDSGLSLSKEALLTLFSPDYLQQIGAFRTMAYSRFRKFYAQLSRDREDCLPALEEEESFDRLSTIGGGVSVFSDGVIGYLITPSGIRVQDVTSICRDTSSRKERLLTACGIEDLYHTGLTVARFQSAPMVKQLALLEQRSKQQIDSDTPYISEAIDYLKEMDDTKLQNLPSGGLGYLVHLFDEFPPDSFAALTKLFSIGHSSKLWVNNFSYLVEEGTVSARDIFTDTESLYSILERYGMDPDIARDIVAAVSIGKGAQRIDAECIKLFEKVKLPEWFAPVLQKICRLHTVAYGVTEADIFCRLIWYCIHDPKLYRKVCVKESE